MKRRVTDNIWLKRSKTASLVVLIFAIVGLTLLLASHAATATSSSEAESGAKTGSAKTILDANASGGSAIQFGGPVVAGSIAWPDATNTGVRNSNCPKGLTASGNITITTPNTTISCTDVTGTIYVDAPNVTISNSKVHDCADICINTSLGPSSSTAMITDTEIYNCPNTACLGRSNWTGIRLKIHNMLNKSDGVKIGTNVTLLDSYIYDFQSISGAHADGGQSEGGDNFLGEHNHIDACPSTTNSGGNSNFIFSPNSGDVTNMTVNDNWLECGNFIVYALINASNHKAGAVLDNINITNNYFYQNKGKVDTGSVAHGTITVSGNTDLTAATQVPSAPLAPFIDSRSGSN